VSAAVSGNDHVNERRCPACGNASNLGRASFIPGGQLQFTCTGPHGDGFPRTFTITPRPPAAAPPARPGAAGSARARQRPAEPVSADLVDPLRGCVHEADGWTEYGVIEHRLLQLVPAVLARHVADHGHIALGTSSAGNSASNHRVIPALQRLRSEGLLHSRIAPATGQAWERSGGISYWSLDPHATATLTWAGYCAAAGRTDSFSDGDRAALAGSTGTGD
jgi:hypothetical protein